MARQRCSKLNRTIKTNYRGEKIMRKKWSIVLCAAVAISAISSAQDKGIGLGVIVGEPTGISAKIWTTGWTALQFGLAWRSGDLFFGTRVRMSGDYLWHSFESIRSTEQFPVFYGVGGEIASGGRNQAWLGIRGVAGITWLARKAPIDVFIQVTPVMILIPSTEFEMGGGIGIRYFFG